jgi:GxxExxY protein
LTNSILRITFKNYTESHREFTESHREFTEFHRETEKIMELNEITQKIIGCAIEVHRNLGPGLLESAYEECLAFELIKTGLNIKRQQPAPVIYKEIKLDYGYRIDILVENLVIVELKVVDALNPVHEAQILTYMKFANKPIGLLINYNVTILKNGIKRYKI